MRRYFKSSEFWQCAVFLAWTLFELMIVGFRIASISVTGFLLGWVSILTGAFFIIRAFVHVVRWRLEDSNGNKSPVVMVFLSGSGTLAFVLQVVWYTLRPK
jgi:hypothetical protein